MSKVALPEGPEGVRLIVASHRHAAALRDGFNSGSAAPTTRWHLPRPLSMIALKGRDLRRYVIVREDGAGGEEVIGTCRLWTPQFAGVELAIAIFDPKARGRG